MTARRSDWVFLACISLIWGTSFQFTKVAVDSLPADAVVVIRLVLAAAISIPLVYAFGLRLPGRDRRWASFFAMAALGNAAPFYLITWGQERVDSGVAGILMATMPLTTLLLAHFFVADERLTRSRLAGFVCGFAGVCLLIGPELLLELGGSSSTFARQLAVVGGAVGYAVNTVIARRLPDTHPLVTSACVMLIASAMMLVLAGQGLVQSVASATWPSVASAVWLGVVSTALAMLLYYRVIASAGATFVSMMNYFIPVVAFLGGVLAMGEVVSVRAIVALLVILGGVVIARREESAGASNV